MFVITHPKKIRGCSEFSYICAFQRPFQGLRLALLAAVHFACQASLGQNRNKVLITDICTLLLNGNYDKLKGKY